MNGYPYQRLSKPNANMTPAPTDVGMMLAQRYGGQQPMGMPMGGVPAEAPGMAEMEMEAPEGGMADYGEDMAEGGSEGEMMGMPMGGMAMGGISPMTQAMMMRLPAQGMAGDYDPASEHSPSSTRIALEQAALRAMGQMKGSEARITPSNTRELLTKLGIPPLELQLMEQSGQLGDTAGA